MFFYTRTLCKASYFLSNPHAGRRLFAARHVCATLYRMSTHSERKNPVTHKPEAKAAGDYTAGNANASVEFRTSPRYAPNAALG